MRASNASIKQVIRPRHPVPLLLTGTLPYKYNNKSGPGIRTRKQGGIGSEESVGTVMSVTAASKQQQGQVGFHEESTGDEKVGAPPERATSGCAGGGEARQVAAPRRGRDTCVKRHAMPCMPAARHGMRSMQYLTHDFYSGLV